MNLNRLSGQMITCFSLCLLCTGIVFCEDSTAVSTPHTKDTSNTVEASLSQVKLNPAQAQLKKIVETVLASSAFETTFQIVLSGDGLKTRPNLPRTGEFHVAVDSTGPQSRKRLSLTLNTFKGSIDLTLVSFAQALYMNLSSSAGGQTAFYYDAQDTTHKKSPLLQAFLGSRKNRPELSDHERAQMAVENLARKARIQMVGPGHILIDSEKNKDSTITLFYDLKTNLPERLEISDLTKKITVVASFTMWKTNPPVNTKLPMDASAYTFFQTEHFSQLFKILPQPNKVFSPHPLSPAKISKPEAQEPSTVTKALEDDGMPVNQETVESKDEMIVVAAPVSEELLQKQRDLERAELVRDVKASTKEMRVIVDTLRSPEFKKNLLNLHIRLNRIERRLEALEED